MQHVNHGAAHPTEVQEKGARLSPHSSRSHINSCDFETHDTGACACPLAAASSMHAEQVPGRHSSHRQIVCHMLRHESHLYWVRRAEYLSGAHMPGLG
jgi:hypothetical protein